MQGLGKATVLPGMALGADRRHGPCPVQHRAHHAAAHAGNVRRAKRAGGSALSDAGYLGGVRAVRQIDHRAARQLRGDGGWAVPQHQGHEAGTARRLLHAGHRHAALGLKQLVPRNPGPVHTRRCWVLHVRLEAAASPHETGGIHGDGQRHPFVEVRAVHAKPRAVTPSSWLVSASRAWSPGATRRPSSAREARRVDQGRNQAARPPCGYPGGPADRTRQDGRRARRRWHGAAHICACQHAQHAQHAQQAAGVTSDRDMRDVAEQAETLAASRTGRRAGASQAHCGARPIL